LKDWGKDFPNCLPSLKGYPELLKISGLIPPEENAESSDESYETEILSQDEDDSDQFLWNFLIDLNIPYCFDHSSLWIIDSIKLCAWTVSDKDDSY
jgi:hypothetical protein